MKRTALRPIYSILLLLVIAATLAVRIALHQNGSFYLNYETLIFQSAAPPPPLPRFNATLLKFAATDIAEPKLKQEIDDLLEGNHLRSRARHRSFLSSGKYRIDARLQLARGTPLHLRSPEFYRVWLTFRRSLSDWWRKRRFSSDVISDLVNEINLPIKRGKSSKKYKTCAVVGNSGILLESDHGKLIDSHQVVIRLNNARTSTFEAHVGSKTTVSFVNSNILHLCARRENCFCHPYGAAVPIVMYICQPAHFLDYLLCNSSHKSQLIVTDPRFDVLCSRIVKYYSLKRFVEVTGKDVGEWGAAHEGSNFHYSSGMQAVMMAVGMCEEVSIFGFGKIGVAKHHYHTGQKAELALHDYEAEYDLYRDLVERPQAIPFVSDKFEFPRVVMYR